MCPPGVFHSLRRDPVDHARPVLNVCGHADRVGLAQGDRGLFRFRLGPCMDDGERGIRVDAVADTGQIRETDRGVDDIRGSPPATAKGYDGNGDVAQTVVTIEELLGNGGDKITGLEPAEQAIAFTPAGWQGQEAAWNTELAAAKAEWAAMKNTTPAGAGAE